MGDPKDGHPPLFIGANMGEHTNTPRIDMISAAIVCGLLAAIALPPPVFSFLPESIRRLSDLNYPSYLKYFLLQTAVCLLFIVWAYRLFAYDNNSWRRPTKDVLPEILFAALLVLTFASAGWSGLPYISILGASVIGFRMGWGLLVSGFNWRGRALNLLALWIIIAGFMASLCTLMVMSFGGELSDMIEGEQDLRHIVMGHRNILACFLLPPICLAIISAVGSWKKGFMKAAVFPSVAAFIMTPTLFLTGSYGAIIGLLASGIFVLFMLVNRRRRARLAYGSAIAALALILVATIAWPRIKPALMRHEQATRYFHTINSLNMISERPILGWGAGAFMSRYPRFRHIDAERFGWMRQRSLHPHNEYFEMTIRVGLIGLALFIGAFFLTMKRALKNLAGTEDWPAALALCAGAIGMMTHGLFTVALGFWGAAAMFWTVTGVLLSAGRPAAVRKKTPAKSKAVPTFMLACVVALTAGAWLFFALDGIIAQHRLSAARRADRNGDYDIAIELYHLAISRMRYVPDYIITHSHLGRCLASAGEFEKSAAAMESMRLLAPDIGALNTDLAQVYTRISTDRRYAGQNELARLYMRRAAAMLNAQVTLRPYLHAGPRMRLAAALMSVDRSYLPVAIEQMRATVILDEAFGRNPPDPVILFLLGRYLAEAGNNPEALTYLEKSAERRRELLPERVFTPDWTPEDEEDAPAILHEIRGLAETEYSIARVLIAMTRRNDARERLKESLRLWPGYPEAEGALGDYFGQ